MEIFRKRGLVSKVENNGFLPLAKRVERMLQAGQQLRLANEAEFDYPPGAEIPEDWDQKPSDPFREPGFGVMEAKDVARAAEERLRERRPMRLGDRKSNSAAKAQSKPKEAEPGMVAPGQDEPASPALD